jgi:uncharacterized protein YgbK (DUF1537 family)
VSRRLADGRPADVVFALRLPDPVAAEATMARTFAALSRTAPPGGLAVVGGDTLFRLCRALDAESLVATGEWAPGIPVARIVGGRWDGVRLVTKSGAFGDPDVLVRLLETATETPCP